jgi:cytochrome P450
MAECPFTPPYPKPLAQKPGLVRRFMLGWNSWIHTLSERAYGMKMGGTRLPAFGIYVINDLPQVHALLDANVHDMPKHRIFDDLVGPLIGESVFNTNGALWERQRAMVNPAFVHTHLQRAFPVMAAAAGDLVNRMRGRVGLTDVDPMMTHVAADVIFRTMFSVELGEAEALRLYAQFEAYQAVAQRSALLRLYRLPQLGMRKKAARLGAQIREIFSGIVAARMAGEDGDKNDILSTLLDLRDPETGAAFGQKDLTDQITLIFLAGHETTATSLGWTLYLLSECPDLQEAVFAEIEAVTGGEDLRFEHLKGLNLLRNVYRESLRLYPPISFFPREAVSDRTLRDKAITAGDMLVASPWLVQRNPQTWECPHQFNPGRFDDPAAAEAVKNAWMPFGRGPRICIGAGFAQQEAAVVLAMIVRNFRLTHPDGPRPELTSRLTLRPKAGFPLELSLR